MRDPQIVDAVKRVLLRDDAQALQYLLQRASSRAADADAALRTITRAALECTFEEEADALRAEQHATGASVEGLLACLICASHDTTGGAGAASPSAPPARSRSSSSSMSTARRFAEASRLIADLRNRGPRQVCQYAFRRNDIVWICRTCQADETCVLCNSCYRDSDHRGHEVYFYHAQAGGCCDCGDPDAWAPEGFCSVHGKHVADPLASLEPTMVARARVVLRQVAASLVAAADG